MYIALMNERNISWIAILSICIAAISVYVESLPYSFTYDDHHYIVENRYIKSWADLASVFKNGYSGVSPEELDLTRPLMPVSLALDYSLWGADPAGFRLTNILLHLANSLLVYVLASVFVSNRWAPLLSALIFAVHPIHVEPVAGITFREDLLVTLFYISALLLYIRFIRYSNVSYYILSLISFILALLSKEMAVTFPLMILASDFYLSERDSCKGQWRYISYWAFIPGYLWFIYGVYSSLKAKPAATGSLSDSILTVINTLGVDTVLLLLPFNLHADYDLAASISIFEPTVIIGLVLLMSAALYLLKGVDKAFAFCISFFLISLLPVINIIPTFRLVADRFLYLPSVGFSIFSGMLLARMVQWDRFRRVVITSVSCLMVLLGVVAVTKGRVWENDLTLWSDVLKKSPASVRAQTAIGVYFLGQGRDDEAVPLFEKAIAFRPDYDKPYYNLGLAYMRRGDFSAAIRSLSKALELNPDYGKARFQLGLAFAQTGQYDKAVTEYEKALKFIPDSAVLYNNLGNAYSANSDYRKAFAAYERAISIDPDYSDPYYNRGNLYARLNRGELALKSFQKAVELNPRNASAYFNMGNVYQSVGDMDKAAEAYIQALNIAPRHKGASEALRQVSDR